MDISTIALIVVGVILGYSLILGFIRGFKKALVRLVWLGVTAVAVFFATPPLAGFLNTFDLSNFNINIYGPVNRLSDVGVNIIKALNLQEALNSSPALRSFAENLPTMILNVILFVVLFWLLKILLYPLFLLIYSRVFNKQRRKEKLYQKRIKKLKKNGMPITEDAPVPTSMSKLRLLGGLIGVVCGLLVIAVTFSPLFGAHSIYTTVNQNVTVYTTEEDTRLAPGGREEPYLKTILPKEVLDIISIYESSTARKILTYTGVEFVGNSAFNELASINVGGQKIKLNDEVTTLTKIYSSGIKVYNITKDYSLMNYSDIDEVIALARSILDDIVNSKMVYVVGNSMTDYFAEKYIIDYVNDSEFELIIDGKDYAKNIQDIVNEMELDKFSISEVKDEIDAVLDIASLFNNIRVDKDGQTVSLLSELVTGGIKEPNEALDFIIDGTSSLNNFATSLVDGLYGIGVFSSVVPIAVNSGVEAMFKALEIGGFREKTDLNAENIKTTLKDFIENALQFYDVYRDGQDLDFGQDTAVALGSIGRILDSLKDNLLSSESYCPIDNTTDGLVNFLINKINEMTSDVIDLSSITSSLRDINSFNTEFSALSPLYRNIVTIVSDEEHPFTFDSLLEQDYPHLNSLGSSINTVVNSGNSKLINNKNLRKVFDILFDELSEGDATLYDLLQTQVDGKTLINIMLDNIYYVDPVTSIATSKIENWANEVTYGFGLIRELATMTNISNASEEDMTSLGEAIDDAMENSKILLSPKVMRVLMDKALTDASATSSEVANILDMQYDNNLTVKGAILNNIYHEGSNTSNVTSYKEEMKALYSLLSGDTSSLSSIGSMLDTMSGSQIFSRNIVKQIVVGYITDEVDNISDATLKGRIQSGAEIIVNNIKNEQPIEGEYLVKFGSELAKLDNIITVITASYSDNGDRLSAIGGVFNNILGLGGSASTPSIVITKEALNSILSSFVDEYVDGISGIDSDLKAIVKKVKGEDNANLANIEDYSLELAYVQNLTSKLQTGGGAAINFIALGEEIDNILSPTSSNLITQDNINELVLYFFKNNSNITNNKASFVSAFDRIENKVVSYSGYVENRYKDLFTEFNTITSNIATLKSVMNNGYDLNSFKSDTTLGSTLDTFANMIYASDRYVARDMAGVIIDKILALCDAQSSVLKTEVEALINGTDYDFSNYHIADTWSITVNESTYYSSLMSSIQGLLPQA